VVVDGQAGVVEGKLDALANRVSATRGDHP